MTLVDEEELTKSTDSSNSIVKTLVRFVVKERNSEKNRRGEGEGRGGLLDGDRRRRRRRKLDAWKSFLCVTSSLLVSGRCRRHYHCLLMTTIITMATAPMIMTMMMTAVMIICGRKRRLPYHPIPSPPFQSFFIVLDFNTTSMKAWERKRRKMSTLPPSTTRRHTHTRTQTNFILVFSFPFPSLTNLSIARSSRKHSLEVFTDFDGCNWNKR